MLPTYFILLVCAIGSILVFSRASHEIPRLLAVGSAVFCLIFGFAMAPWPIQLLICLLIFRLEWLYPYSKPGAVTLPILPIRRK